MEEEEPSNGEALTLMPQTLGIQVDKCFAPTQHGEHCRNVPRYD
jgi:hypothetical protein